MKAFLKRCGFLLLAILTLGTIYIARRPSNSNFGICVKCFPAILIFWAAGLLLFHFSLRWYTQFAGDARLEEELAYLRQNDQRWTFEEIIADRPRVPDTENGIVIVKEIQKKLVQFPEWEVKDDPTLFRIPDHNFLEKNWNLSLDRELLVGLRGFYRDAKDVAALSADFGWFPKGQDTFTVTPNPLETLLTDAQYCRDSFRFLQLETLLFLEEGDPAGRVPDRIRFTMYVQSYLRDSPFAIESLVRLSGRRIACRMLAAYLGRKSKPDQLESLQKLFEQEEAEDLFRIALRGERAVLDLVF